MISAGCQQKAKVETWIGPKEKSTMSNLSYIRFRMTAADLLDCRRALQRLSDRTEAPLTAAELDGAKQLVQECQRVLTILAQDIEAGSDGRVLDRSFDGVLTDLNATLANAAVT
jgi:hypothetical protein